ncbi:MAG: nucleotidyl transferase AbiEii/AbiGii toxin family protein [Acidobacteria bacterium]|nr:nucleotidyl transferase AbiEii/AbiGii toxin family protein [Acidobacteriota bacterium]
MHGAFVRFPGVLNEIGLSPHPSEVLAIRIEVDTRPPAGAATETTLVRRHETLRLFHHDRASLLAGKLHAILQRPYAKGRDVYDLIWYLSDPEWPPPSLSLLNAALAQTGWSGDAVTPETWRTAIANRMEALDWPPIVADVAPFLERTADVDLLTRGSVMKLLGR